MTKLTNAQFTFLSLATKKEGTDQGSPRTAAWAVKLGLVEKNGALYKITARGLQVLRQKPKSEPYWKGLEHLLA